MANEKKDLQEQVTIIIFLRESDSGYSSVNGTYFWCDSDWSKFKRFQSMLKTHTFTCLGREHQDLFNLSDGINIYSDWTLV